MARRTVGDNRQVDRRVTETENCFVVGVEVLQLPLFVVLIPERLTVVTPKSVSFRAPMCDYEFLCVNFHLLFYVRRFFVLPLDTDFLLHFPLRHLFKYARSICKLASMDT